MITRQRLKTGLNWIVLSTASLFFIIPFFWVAAGALKDKSVFTDYLFFPPLREWSSQTLNFNNFRVLFQGEETLQGTVYFWQYIVNSLFVASTTTVLQLFTSALAGYALAFFHFPYKKTVIWLLTGILMIPPMLLLSPVYEVIYNLGWMDSYLSLIVPPAVNSVGVILFYQAMKTVPYEILEAARVDGCKEFRIFSKIVLPLVKPISATYTLVVFLTAWGNFLAPNIFIHSHEKLPLTVVLNMYVTQYSEQYGVFLAGTLIAIIPPAILFLVLQKDFVRGLTSGAVKG
jgi:ABC-type glycerol-3-phosphate transport system permease component